MIISSLGGANAYIVAAHMAIKLQMRNIRIVTFASPKVGDATFVSAMSKWVPDMKRYVTFYNVHKDSDLVITR